MLPGDLQHWPKESCLPFRGHPRSQLNGVTNQGVHVGIGGWRILWLLRRILQLKFSHSLKELCSFIIGNFRLDYEYEIEYEYEF